MGFNDKALRSGLRRAIRLYDLLATGDRVLVAVSGGVDSMGLLHLLTEESVGLPVSFDVTAVQLTPAPDGEAARGLADHLRRVGRPFVIEEHRQGPDESGTGCFACARRRRRRLFELARDHGCTKVALGHTMDDVVETFLLNLSYSAETSTLLPRQPLFDGAIVVIRPLYHIEKRSLRRLARDHDLPVWESTCPWAGTSKRARVRTLLAGLSDGDRKVKKNIFRALFNVNRDHLPR